MGYAAAAAAVAEHTLAEVPAGYCFERRGSAVAGTVAALTVACSGRRTQSFGLLGFAQHHDIPAAVGHMGLSGSPLQRLSLVESVAVG